MKKNDIYEKSKLLKMPQTIVRAAFNDEAQNKAHSNVTNEKVMMP